MHALEIATVLEVYKRISTRWTDARAHSDFPADAAPTKGKLQAVNNLCVVAKKENKPWPKAAFSDENGIVHTQSNV